MTSHLQATLPAILDCCQDLAVAVEGQGAERNPLIGTVLHDLAADAETMLFIANALEERVSGISSNAEPQKLRETAALVKCAALQLGLAAANVVGCAERLRLVAEFGEVTNATSSKLPS